MSVLFKERAPYNYDGEQKKGSPTNNVEPKLEKVVVRLEETVIEKSKEEVKENAGSSYKKRR